MENVVGVVVEQRQRVVALPCDVVLPGEVRRVVKVLEVVVLAAQLPDDLAGLPAHTHHGVHVARRDDVVPVLGLVDAVDMEEVEGIFLGLAVSILAVRIAVYVGHADVVGGAPFKQQLTRLDVDFLEQAVLDPAFFAKFEVGAVGFVFVVDGDEGGALWRDAELVRVPLQMLADRSYSIRDFVRRVQLARC